MKSWAIGEVARLLGVRTHVIRYWESELPLLSPKKSPSGRRTYSAGDVQLLMKFRHLLYDRKFTVEGAKRRLWEELGAGDPDVAARFAAVRANLIDALMLARRNCERSAGGEGDEMNERDVVDQLTDAGQEHLFAYWDERPSTMKRRLLEDLAGLDLGLVRELRNRLGEVDRRGNAAVRPPVPARYVQRSESRSDGEARDRGEEIIRRGKTAFLTVAGGQGSRLGYDGPKGMFPVTPLRRHTLFALFAEKLLAARRRYGAEISWLIMTGTQNHAATMGYFASNDWFGLGGETVRIIVQGSVPSLSPEGRVLMAPDGGLLFNPNGHGGVIDALRVSGSLAALQRQGVDHLFYFQVDNPLVRVPDPLFLGFHARAGSRISSKVIEKAYPEERLGVIVEEEGVPSVIEYSDLAGDLMHARDRNGRLRYGQGSIAIHILDVDFLADPRLRLPWHLARKKAKTLNPLPGGTETIERDAIKMEMFIFDAIPRAARALFFETERAEEFAPLKNREGTDSIETCTRGQVEQAARWLELCGVEVPRDGDGRSRYLVEISPLFALDPVVLGARRGILKDRIDEDTLLA